VEYLKDGAAFEVASMQVNFKTISYEDAAASIRVLQRRAYGLRTRSTCASRSSPACSRRCEAVHRTPTRLPEQPNRLSISNHVTITSALRSLYPPIAGLRLTGRIGIASVQLTLDGRKLR
jgi:hypothetical protein